MTYPVLTSRDKVLGDTWHNFRTGTHTIVRGLLPSIPSNAQILTISLPFPSQPGLLSTVINNALCRKRKEMKMPMASKICFNLRINLCPSGTWHSIKY
jgi:hypothetical protein